MATHQILATTAATATTATAAATPATPATPATTTTTATTAAVQPATTVQQPDDAPQPPLCWWQSAAKCWQTLLAIQLLAI